MKIAAILAGAIVVGTATTAAAVPVIVAWAPWKQDVVVQRVFPLETGGSANCTLVMNVQPDYATADENMDRNVADARSFLQHHEWDDLVVISAREAAEGGRVSDARSQVRSAAQAAAAEAQREYAARTGTSPAPLPTLTSTSTLAPAIGELNTDITARAQKIFADHGYLKPGVSIETGVKCDPEPAK